MALGAMGVPHIKGTALKVCLRLIRFMAKLHSDEKLCRLLHWVTGSAAETAKLFEANLLLQIGPFGVRTMARTIRQRLIAAFNSHAGAIAPPGAWQASLLFDSQ